MKKVKQFSIPVIKGDINKALKKWKRKFEEFEIREELISRKEFVKPSVVKRKQKNQTIRQHQRELQRLQEE